MSAVLAEAAHRDPGRVAVGTPSGATNYRQLAEIAGRVQSAIVQLGVRHGDRVAIIGAPVTEHTIAAIHGVLAAGAIWVPIDPGSPPARWASIVAMADPAAVVAYAGALDLFTAVAPNIPAVVIDKPAKKLLDEVPATGKRIWLGDIGPAELRPHGGDQADIAYILPTSGTTGVPKGVALSHQAGLAFADWMVSQFAVSADDVVAAHAPLHFDMSVFSLFGTARAGASIVPVPLQLSSFPAELADWIANQRISVWFSVPYPLIRLARLGVDGLLQVRNTLRTVLFGGEVFAHEQLAVLMRALPDTQFANLFGPTETNACTAEVLTEIPSEPVPIGRATAGAHCWVEDHQGRVLTADGSVGELVVAGPTVASGYWGQMEAGAGGFRVGPELWAGRGFATGDWVEIYSGRRFLYRGRRDHMVKINGQRLELGEVESVIAELREVRGCCVLPLGGHEDPRLGAVIASEALGEEDIREHCRARLPRWAVPARIVLVEELPLGSTGKLDRLAAATLFT